MMIRKESPAADGLSVRPVPAAVFLAALVLFACVLPEEAEPVTHKDEPCRWFMGLKDYPVYVKKGFEDVSRNTVDPEGWKKVSTAGVVKVRDMDFGFPRRAFLSPLAEKDQHFTLLLFFFADSTTLEKIHSCPRSLPGMFFSGLGDNWAVYLNGNEVRREMYLDSEGQIQSHRSWRSVFFPVERAFFKEGINTVMIHIAGGAHFETTGISCRGPWYIAPYENIIQDHNGRLAIALCGICFFVGLYYFLIFMNRRNELYNLYFSLFSIILGLYGITRSNFVYSLVPDSSILIRIEYISIFAALPLLTAFVEHLHIKRTRKASKIYAVFCLVCALGCLSPSLSVISDIHILWEISAVGWSCYLFGYDVAYAFFSETLRNRKKHKEGMSFAGYCGQKLVKTPLGNLFISMSLLFVTALLDILNSLFIQYDVFLSRYGFFIFTLGSAFILNGKFNVLYRRLHQLNEELETSNLHLEETVRRRTKELEKQTRAAESASRAKSEFLAHISHEIRTPMNAILGMTELMFQKRIPPDIYENALSVKHAGENLLSIINDVLDFSGIESGRLELVPLHYALSSLLNDCVTVIRMRFAEKPLLFLVNADSTLPNKLNGDENRLRQIIINLLTNAFKYTRKGFAALSVYGERRGEKGIMLSFEVKDTGIGIKKDDIKKLFDTFTRLNLKRNRNIEGTGLGLAITRNLCRLMGGDITVESRYGEGSIFTARVVQEIRGNEVLAQVAEAEQKSVLVCESRMPLVQSLRASLENLGIPAVFTETSDAFFTALEQGPYAGHLVRKPQFSEQIPLKTAVLQAAGRKTARLVRQPTGLSNKSYTFALVPSCLAKETAAFIRERKLPVKAAALVSADEAPSVHIPLIRLPVYAVPLEHFFNGKTVHRRKKQVSFTAPTAEVLVVDDIAVNIKVAEGFLSLYRINVDSASSGKAALRMFSKKRYDLVLMDHMMPGMDGVESARRIRAMDDPRKRTPIVALTANAVSGIREFFLQRGFDDFLAKPMETSKLDEILLRWIPKDKQIRPDRQLREGSQVDSTETDRFFIEGVDTVKGIALSGGTMDAYREVLAAFLEDSAEKRAELGAFSPDTEDLGSFAVAVHGIKGAAAIIGAQSLSEKALVLEKAAKSDDRTGIEKHFAEFYRELEATAARIRAALDA